jgi:hypothetical protein
MMTPPCSSCFPHSRALMPVLLGVFLAVSCSPPVQRPTGVAYDYMSTKEMFQRGNFDRALEFSEELAKASPPNKFTERARVLRAAIYSGQIKAYKELAEAYQKGADATKNMRFKSAYERLRNDDLQYGARSALGLGEVSHQFTELGELPKEVTLEAPYPTAEGPAEVTQLQRVVEGGWIEPEDQEAAALEALRKGIDDSLAELVGGDRAKARTEMTAGPVKIDGVDFALYLGNQLLEGASVFDRKHMRDSQKLTVLCNEADEVAKAALALLKTNPDKDKEKAVKKLQDEIKTALKNR